MEREKHEELINELLTPDLETSRKTEILQELRTDYGSVLTTVDDLTKSTEKLQKNNTDLVISNSKLFRQLGEYESKGNNEQHEQKEFSETITIEELERG